MGMAEEVMIVVDIGSNGHGGRNDDNSGHR